jgi:hypothetical protein
VSANGSFRIPVYSGIFEHRRKIDRAIWVFLWCLDRTTREENGVGFVLGGTVVTSKRIAKELDDVERNIQRQLEHLAAAGYLGIERQQHGQVITVRNSKKFGNSRLHKNDDLKIEIVKRDDLPVKFDDLTAKIDDPIKEDTAVDSAVDLKPIRPGCGNLPEAKTEKLRPFDSKCPACKGEGLIFPLIDGWRKARRCETCRGPSQPTEKPKAEPLRTPAVLKASA